MNAVATELGAEMVQGDDVDVAVGVDPDDDAVIQLTALVSGGRSLA
jgi:hypothetical protein